MIISYPAFYCKKIEYIHSSFYYICKYFKINFWLMNTMNNSYSDLVNQTFNFPQEDFKVEDAYLKYNGQDLKALIDKYGTPLKLTYLPKIGSQIDKAKKMFANAFKKYKYEGKYNYCYCTKSSHFSFIVEEALKNNIHIETSFAYDIDIVNKLYSRRKINKETFVICNGLNKNLTLAALPNC